MTFCLLGFAYNILYFEQFLKSISAEISFCKKNMLKWI